MKSYWLIKKNNPKLLLFFSGWGMDEHPFLRIDSQVYDVFMFYDYSIISNFDNKEIEDIINKYRSVDLIGWSMGVWAASYLLKNYKHKFENAIALNGTLFPIDDNYGIPDKIYQLTIDNFSDTGRKLFNKRMCVKSEIFNEFENTKPQRSIEELKQELIVLKESILNNQIDNNIYNKALISKNDKIIPFENQMRFWDGKICCNILEGPHFMFYNWKKWEDIIINAPKH